jgi:hypothetical protein
LFVLIKGNLQGATKSSQKSGNKLKINKKSFLDSFKSILKAQNQEVLENLNYFEAKNLSSNFNSAAGQFYLIYKGWIRTDPEKYYKFQ